MTRIISKLHRQTALVSGALLLMGGAAFADQQILDDLIVDGSICAGQDCVNGEAFGFDTLRLKENNLRIKAQDTSTSASFPTVDWQLTFNDSANGGANKFSVDSIDNGATPFTIEYGASTNALYLDDGGRLGLGTNTPVSDIHVKSGNTPTLRLEQDGSSGFSAQIWDLASNEANFFLRDASNGSTLPFRAFPSAPSNALTIAATGNIGMGVQTADKELHIEGTGAVETQFESTDGGAVQVRLITTRESNRRIVGLSADGSPSSSINLGDDELTFYDSGNNVIGILNTAGLTVNGTAMNVPDYVFNDDYNLRPLADVQAFIDENSHLPEVPSAAEINGGQMNMTAMQLTLLKKVEELTLYTLAQDSQIKSLEAKLEALAD